MHTLETVKVINRIVIIVEKPDVATTVASKDTKPAIARRINHSPEEERFKDPGQARPEEIKPETVKDDFNHAARVESNPRRPKKHVQRFGARCPREELNSTISTDKPEGKFDTWEYERRESRTRICDSPVHVSVDCGATSDFMSMQTATKARLFLYKLTHQGRIAIPHESFYLNLGIRISTPLQSLVQSARCAAWVTMASKL